MGAWSGGSAEADRLLKMIAACSQPSTVSGWRLVRSLWGEEEILSLNRRRLYWWNTRLVSRPLRHHYQLRSLEMKNSCALHGIHWILLYREVGGLEGWCQCSTRWGLAAFIVIFQGRFLHPVVIEVTLVEILNLSLDRSRSFYGVLLNADLKKALSKSFLLPLPHHLAS